MPRIAGTLVSWGRLIAGLRREAARHPILMADRIARETRGDPFCILVAVMLSARSRDEITEQVVRRLFEYARTPRAIRKISERRLQKTLRPLGMYRQKTRNVRATALRILETFDGRVPRSSAALLSLPGVGSKTANLVLSLAFGVPAIAVDTHVHRLSNAFGLVRTATPRQTEAALVAVLPRRYWREWNRLLVTWGKYVCPRDASYCVQHLREVLYGGSKQRARTKT